MPEILLFDGHCPLCHWSVEYVYKRDSNRRFVFCPLQSEAGHLLVRRYQINALAPESFALIAPGGCKQQGEALIAVLRLVRSRWRYPLRCLPGPVVDWLYRFVAKRRYRLFPPLDTCPVPAPSLAARFVYQPHQLPEYLKEHHVTHPGD